MSKELDNWGKDKNALLGGLLVDVVAAIIGGIVINKKVGDAEYRLNQNQRKFFKDSTIRKQINSDRKFLDKFHKK